MIFAEKKSKTAARKKSEKKVNAFRAALENAALNDGKTYFRVYYEVGSKRQADSARWNLLLWARSTADAALYIERDEVEKNADWVAASIIVIGGQEGEAAGTVVGTKTGYSAHNVDGSLADMPTALVAAFDGGEEENAHDSAFMAGGLPEDCTARVMVLNVDATERHVYEIEGETAVSTVTDDDGNEMEVSQFLALPTIEQVLTALDADDETDENDENS